MQSSGGKGRLLIAGIVVIVAVVGYFSQTAVNPVTGEKQHIAMTQEQEVALGLQATPQMLSQFGGEDPNPQESALVDRVGADVVAKSKAGTSPYRFTFHALADNETINAFALPGGQVFITRALLRRLKTEGQLAGVLGHEVGHVVGRHGAEHMAKAQLTQGLTGAAVVATYDPRNPRSGQSAALAALVGQLVDLKYGRNDELEADKFGVEFMSEAGYDPRSMVEVMKILKSAGGSNGQPEFFSTHPNPDNRIEKIEAAIKDQFPNGVPSGLKS